MSVIINAMNSMKLYELWILPPFKYLVMLIQKGRKKNVNKKWKDVAFHQWEGKTLWWSFIKKNGEKKMVTKAELAIVTNQIPCLASSETKRWKLIGN